MIIVKGSVLDKESKSYVGKVIPIILADLRKGTTMKYTSDDLRYSKVKRFR